MTRINLNRGTCAKVIRKRIVVRFNGLLFLTSEVFPFILLRLYWSFISANVLFVSTEYKLTKHCIILDIQIAETILDT